ADPAEERLWAATVTPTLKLQAVATPPARPQLPSLPELNSPLETLEYQLTELRGKFQSGAATALLQRANPAELRHALNSPLWSGPDRARMFAAANRLEAELMRDAQSKSVALHPGASPPPAGTPVPESPSWRARLAIDLLKLDGFSDPKPLEKLLDEANAKKSPDVWE